MSEQRDEYAVQAEQRVQRLEDIEDVRRLKALYAQQFDDALNRRRPFPSDALVDLFATDAIWTSELFGRFEGKNAIRDFFASYRERVSFCLHFLMNAVIDVAEDRRTASARWHTWEPMTLDGGAFILAGHYKDECERLGERWLFKSVRLDVAYLVPYQQGWANERVPPDWKW